MNGTNKDSGRENPTKNSGPIVQGMVKTQLEVLEVENDSLCPHICSLNYAMNVECIMLK